MIMVFVSVKSGSFRYEIREKDPVHMMDNMGVVLGNGKTVFFSQSRFLHILSDMAKQQSQKKS